MRGQVTRAFCTGKYFCFRVLQGRGRATIFKFRTLLRMIAVTTGGLMFRIVWAGLGAAAAAALIPLALAHADDGVTDAGSLTLVKAGPEVPNTALGPDGYVGDQPFFTEWQQDQPINVDVGSSTVGSYDVSETDYATPLTDESIYDFGTPTSGTDPGGLADATVTDFALDPSFNAGTEQMPPPDVTAALDNLNVTFGNGDEEDVVTTAAGTNYFVYDPGVGSADWFTAPGSTDPTELFSALSDSSAALAAVQDLSSLLPYDVWFPGI
jgi:hypothetical protein